MDNTTQLNTPQKRHHFTFGPFSSFMKLERIPVLLYMLGNIFFSYMGISFAIALFFEDAIRLLTNAGQEIVCWAISAALFFIALLVSLSPIGESILRYCYKCQPIDDEADRQKLMPLFYEVYSRAKDVEPGIPDEIQLFIDRGDESLNAFAIGRKTICISSGLSQGEPAQIQAAMAHEFGHLAHRDTNLLLAVNITNYLFCVFFIVPLIFFGSC